MARITVPAQFFRNELGMYANQKEAFARELLQNSLDADATRIDVRVETVDGRCRVTFTDDGHGMSREVLKDCFFALGGSTKTGGSTIGGFGRARIILCFAQESYRIRTGNLLVEGSGGEYEIYEVEETLKGCTFTIDLVDDWNADAIRWAFRSLLARSTLTVPITLDGEQPEQATRPPRAARVLRDTDGNPWARVYVERCSYSSQAHVRVNGLQMFSKWLSTDDKVYLELVPERSREVMTANRDGLTVAFSDQLDQFTNALATSRRAALKETPVQPLERRVGPNQWFVSDAPGATDSAEEADTADGGAREPALYVAANEAARASAQAKGPLGVHALPVDSAEGTGTADGGAQEPALYFAANEAAQPPALQSVPALPAQASPAYQLPFPVALRAEDHNRRVAKLEKIWDPANWTLANAKRQRTLILAWKAVLQVVIDELLVMHPELGRISWGVGWVFDKETGARHVNSDGDHLLLLNPVNERDGHRYALSKEQDRQRLIVFAAHEVAHIAVRGGHNNDYAALFTHLMARIDMKACHKAIAQVKSPARKRPIALAA